MGKNSTPQIAEFVNRDITSILRFLEQHMHEEARQRLQEAIDQLKKQDVTARLMTVNQINKSIFQIGKALAEIDCYHSKIRQLQHNVPMPLLEEYKRGLHTQKIALEIAKKRIARGRNSFSEYYLD